MTYSNYGAFFLTPFDIDIFYFMNRDKSGSGLRRTIIHLSWSKVFSVNGGVKKNSYLRTVFQLYYPSVDNIIQQLIKVVLTAGIFKIDTSRAFIHIGIDPGDIDLLGLTHRGPPLIRIIIPYLLLLNSVKIRIDLEFS